MVDAIVIGSGMSGLTTAVILAKEGMAVRVLEQGARPGGLLSRFHRAGLGFDVGFHYTGAMEPGQVLATVLAYCGVYDELELVPFDVEGYDELRYPGFSFTIPAGRERFREALSRRFPGERDAIARYLTDVRAACDGFALYNLRDREDPGYAAKWLALPLAEYLGRLTDDPRLRAVLAAQFVLHGVPPARASFGLHAMVADSFMQNPYGFRGGGEALVRPLVEQLRALGGELHCDCHVEEILVDSHRGVGGVRLADGTVHEAPLVVSSIHPKETVRMLPAAALHPGWRRRVMAMEESAGVLTAFAATRADLGHFGRRNLWAFPSVDDLQSTDFVFATTPGARDGTQPNEPMSLVAIRPMPWSEIERWSGTTRGKRGSEYRELKRRAALELLVDVEQMLPELRGDVELLDAATPLTFRDYTLSDDGSAYGILRSVAQVGKNGIAARTRVDGLYLTGQSLLGPGVLGAGLGALKTCGEILGAEHLLGKVRAAQQEVR